MHLLSDGSHPRTEVRERVRKVEAGHLLDLKGNFLVFWVSGDWLKHIVAHLPLRATV